MSDITDGFDELMTVDEDGFLIYTDRRYLTITEERNRMLNTNAPIGHRSFDRRLTDRGWLYTCQCGRQLEPQPSGWVAWELWIDHQVDVEEES